MDGWEGGWMDGRIGRMDGWIIKTTLETCTCSHLLASTFDDSIPLLSLVFLPLRVFFFMPVNVL